MAEYKTLRSKKFWPKFCSNCFILLKLCDAKQQLSSLKKNNFVFFPVTFHPWIWKNDRVFLDDYFIFKRQDQNFNVHIQYIFQLDNFGDYINFMIVFPRFYVLLWNSSIPYPSWLLSIISLFSSYFHFPLHTIKISHDVFHLINFLVVWILHFPSLF